MVDYVSQGEVAGELVDLGGGELGVIHSDTETGRLGAASIANGNCVYEIDKASGYVGTAVAVGTTVNIDGNNEAAAAGTAFGPCMKASAAGDPTVWARFTGS